MVQPTCEQLHHWKQANKPVTYMTMDSAGENKKLEDTMNSKDWKLNIEPKYMAHNTPQQNHLAESSLASVANKSHAMMIAAHVPEEQVYRVAKEAICCATHINGLVVRTIDGKTDTRYVHFGDMNPKFAAHLKIWGEAGTVTIKGTIHSKLKTRGDMCMVVGYAPKHTGDTSACGILIQIRFTQYVISRG
jgi:hypothetical protein